MSNPSCSVTLGIALLLGIAPGARGEQAATASAEQIGKGVYVLIHPSTTPNFPHGNTTVVVGERAVLVVDSTYLPSMADADIATIRTLTDKPVRYVVNTHWHYDHNNGNSAYRRAFPGVEIVAHLETKRLMDAQSPSYVSFALAPDSPFRTMLADGRKRLAVPGLAEPERTDLAAEVAQRENELTEFGSFEYTSPTLTFDREIRLDLGGREVRVLNFGRGNTPGDAVVHVPDEQIVATGDLLVWPVPYCFNSYPGDWVTTLDRVRALRGRILVPGHGPVMHDDGYLVRVQALLQSAITQAMAYARTHPQSPAGDKIDDVRKTMDFAEFRKEFVGDKPGRNGMFDASIVGALVERALAWARGQQ